ncbi:BQ2448_7017 [Microbotryum intermedium]|uniref:BQ2448_7017 protein n=1 Tax=Microbotryum intermedium TaxID=269621 RepID=A0A238FH03_9BASI|nr:BQ2448_7017 [Microbotryum intermedium]
MPSVMARPQRHPRRRRRRLDARLLVTILAWTLVLCSVQRASFALLAVSASPLPVRTTSLAEVLVQQLQLQPRRRGPAPMMIPVPTVTAAPVPPLYRRNSVAVPKNDTDLTIDRVTTSFPTALAANSTSTSPATNATPSSNPNTQSPISGLFGAGLTSSWLKWIAVVTAVGIGLSLLFARWFCVRRYAHITVRSFLVPRTGVSFPFTKFRINGPPLRNPWEPPPTYYYATYGYGPSSRRPRRRDRRTAGEGISASGARVGERDEDDRLEGETALVGEGLPGYHVDRELPQYATLVEQSHANGVAAADAATSEGGLHTLSNAPEGQTGIPNDDLEIPTVQEYEMASRQGGGTGGAAAGATGDDGGPHPSTSDGTRGGRSADSPSDDDDSLNDGVGSPLIIYPSSPLILPPPIARLPSSRSARFVATHLPNPTRVDPTRASEDRDSLRSTVASSSSTKIKDFDQPHKIDGSSSKDDVSDESTEAIEMKEVRKKEDDD